MWSDNTGGFVVRLAIGDSVCTQRVAAMYERIFHDVPKSGASSMDPTAKQAAALSQWRKSTPGGPECHAGGATPGIFLEEAYARTVHQGEMARWCLLGVRRVCQRSRIGYGSVCVRCERRGRTLAVLAW